MTVEKITRLRQRGWENMMRIALRYPKNCKRRVFAKWDNRNQRLGKKLKRILDSPNAIGHPAADGGSENQQPASSPSDTPPC